MEMNAELYVQSMRGGLGFKEQQIRQNLTVQTVQDNLTVSIDIVINGMDNFSKY